MIKAALKSLFARKARLVFSAFAVVLGVAFVAGSLVFTDTLGRAFDGIMRGGISDVAVQPADMGSGLMPGAEMAIPRARLESVRAVSGVARAEGTVSSPGVFVIGKDGKVIASAGPPSLAFNWHDAPALKGAQGIVTLSGRAPAARDEVMLDPSSASRGGYELGDTVTLSNTRGDPKISATLVGTGTVGGGSTAGATYAIFDTATTQHLLLDGKDSFTGIWVVAGPGVDRAELAARIQPLLPQGWVAYEGQRLADKMATEVQEGLSFISIFLLVFAGIALVVGSFLIVNTFSIIVAQRTKELALFRALGASRRQVSRSVLLEGLVVALIGSGVGVLLGLGLARGIQALFSMIGLDIGSTGLVVTSASVIVSLVAGVVVTLMAAWLPARRAGRIAPVVAMSEDATTSEKSMTTRIVIGSALIVGGLLAVYAGVVQELSPRIAWAGLGMLALVIGAAATSPFVGRPVLWLLGRVYRAGFGMVGQLAELNAVRNPRRTAATASALMIGLALVTTMATLGESMKVTTRKVVHAAVRADFMVDSPTYTLFPTQVGDAMARIDGVAAVHRLRSTMASINGERRHLGSMEAESFNRMLAQELVAGSLQDFTGHALMLPEKAAREKGYAVGQTLPVVTAAGTVELKVTAIYRSPEGAGLGWLTTSSAFAETKPPDQDQALAIHLAPGADKAAVQRALDAALADLPMVVAKDVGATADAAAQPVNQLLTLVYGLLGLAVVIAVLGIVNTLAMSVIERTKEIGLLRATGMARSQVRRMIILESVAISLLGSVMGVGLGLGCGTILQRLLASDGLSELAIPFGSIALFLGAAVVVGILAAILPAVRASRLNVLRSIATA